MGYDNTHIVHALKGIARSLDAIAESLARIEDRLDPPPHAVFRPELFNLDGKWYARSGPRGVDGGLTGVGDTPAEAVASFDRRYFEG